jgi:hypothetical protein
MLPAERGRDLHYAASKTRLQSLRAVFSAGVKADVYSTLFDDFLSNGEFGLALEVLCDFLLEPGVRPVSELELNEIASLRALMEVEDQCFLRLRKKRQDIENTHEYQ